jgi:hypothetical protein
MFNGGIMRLLEAALREAWSWSRHRPATAGQRSPQTMTDQVGSVSFVAVLNFRARSLY